jgi:putative membrane protein
MGLIKRWLMSILSTWVVLMVMAGYFSDYFFIRDWKTALFTAFILSIANAVVKPILILLTLPITILTLGFFLLVINALVLLAVSSMVDGFTISGFWAAFLIGILISLLNYLIYAFILKRFSRQ